MSYIPPTVSLRSTGWRSLHVLLQEPKWNVVLLQRQFMQGQITVNCELMIDSGIYLCYIGGFEALTNVCKYIASEYPCLQALFRLLRLSFMCMLSCLGGLVGKSVAWKADGCGFKSHPRQPISLWKMTVSGEPCLSQHLLKWLFMQLLLNHLDTYTLWTLWCTCAYVYTLNPLVYMYSGKEILFAMCILY